MILEPGHKKRRRKEKHDNLDKWHQWFAWHPVRLDDTDDLVWLVTVYRKGTFHAGWQDGDWWTWDYALHPSVVEIQKSKS